MRPPGSSKNLSEASDFSFIGVPISCYFGRVFELP